MKYIMILLSVFLLHGCFLFMHKCDSLTGWCTISSTAALQEYNFWRTKKEFDNLKKNSTLALSPKEREEENNKKKSILSGCNIDPYTGKLQNGVSQKDAYDCAHKKDIYMN
ncbi:hypothetical protein [Rodentibacter caecimuris]|uniref:hypothetical protein n=1 Tax=Rodentibacter caecimuris TaxID=1796644 RepID=UPI000985174C|nr:hypothetical protein BKG97_10170 [Rodentibacter heylii]